MIYTLLLLMLNHVAGMGKDNLAPSLLEVIGLADDLHELRLELLLRLEQMGPRVVAYLALGEQCLEGELGLPDFHDASDVRHGASDEGCN